jgi:hypothetical protein
MTDAGNSDLGLSGDAGDEGVLARLPPKRPQRSSRRRAAARGATVGARTAPAQGGTEATDAGTAATKAGSPTTRTGTTRTKARTAAAGGRARRPGKGGQPARFSKRQVGPRPRPAAGPRPDSSERRDGVPRQGFESESDSASGPVQPPGGIELVASAAEIVAELARAGLSAGERLLGDLVGRLPRP